ncbi:golgin subfamily A member 6-like protein 22 [Lineus longissimus]|uniref:golgin subfamily A member 6-like protein 22 n=1 Tax=Lineus longissimus TaxID=88925 RepID=UPI00315D760A
MQLKAASADSGIRVADYSRQNDTVFTLSAENKHWKRKFVDELALRREEETFRKNELMSLHADIAAVEEKAKTDQTEWRLREFVRSQEFNQAEEDFRNKQEELTTKLTDMKFKHGLDIFSLEERFRKEVKEIRNTCDRIEQERQEERAESEARMKAQLDEARSKSERLTAMVSKLKEEREVDKMIAKMADSNYIDINKFREKEAEYDRLQERFVKLGKEKERVVLEAKKREERLVKEFQAKEAEMLSDADERRKSVLKERREAAAKERRVVREANSRVEEARAEGEKVVAELKRVSEQVQSDMREEFEERARSLRGEFGKQGMRLLKASREREDHLRAELAKEEELRRSVEEDATKKIEEYQDLVREMDHLSECLSMEKAGRVEDRGVASREKADLDSLIERQGEEFQKLRVKCIEQGTRHEQECRELESAWEEERDAWAEKYDSMNAELELTKMAYDMELESEQEKRLEEKSSSFEKIEQFREAIEEYNVLFEELKSNHEQEHSQLKGTFERRLEEEETRHEGFLAELKTQWHDFEKSVENVIDRCEGLEREVAVLQRKSEWQTIGTDCWVAIMKRHHKADLDDMRCRLESCEGELSVAKNRSTVLLKSIEKQEAADAARRNNHKAEVEQLTRRLETSESEQSVANARASFYLEKLRRTEQALNDTYTVHQDILNEADKKVMELSREYEEEFAELDDQFVKQVEDFAQEEERLRQSETDLESRKRDVMQRERSLDAREKNLQERNVMMMNGLADLSKQDTKLKNMQEELKHEEVNVLRMKEDLVTEKGIMDARVAEIKTETDRLQDMEIDMVEREKEARRSLESAQKVPDRLPIDRSLGELTDTKEQLVALKKQLTEQEWYFLAREGEFQEAKVEVNRYRKMEEKMKLLELELQEKTTRLQGMEVAVRVKEAKIDSTMLEVDGIRQTLRMDRRYTARRNRGCQATQENIVADLEAVNGTSVQCGDEASEEQNHTTNTDEINNDTKMPNEDEKSFQEMKSRCKVVIHYNLEEDAHVEEESDTKAVGLQKHYPSVMDQVYQGPQSPHQRYRMAHPNFHHGPPPQNFCRPPPPGYHPMRPHLSGRPHPRMGPPPPYGPRPHGPGYGPPHPHGPRPGFYRPYGPYGQPPHNGARRQHPVREDQR